MSIVKRVRERVQGALARRSPAFRARERFRFLEAQYPKLVARDRAAVMAFAKSDLRLTNFYYEIGNLGEAAALVANAMGVPPMTVHGLFDELQGDEVLRAELSARVAGRREYPRELPYARRAIWYAITRLSRPAVVVETGVDDGLGTATLAAALARNDAEAPGQNPRVYGFDFAKEGMGFLLPARLAPYYTLVPGNLRETLPSFLARRVPELFVQDSDHTEAHERFELGAFFEVAKQGSVIVSDNPVPTLVAVAKERGLHVHLHSEQPLNHWYSGGNTGVVVVGT